MDLREHIRAYIIENFLFGDVTPLTGDTISLLDNGIIDSVGVMELVAYLEQDHELTIEDEELIPENLDSVDNLVQFVTCKKGAQV
ncbi:MAG: acyl carrier protein [bacterium]